MYDTLQDARNAETDDHDLIVCRARAYACIVLRQTFCSLHQERAGKRRGAPVPSRMSSRQRAIGPLSAPAQYQAPRTSLPVATWRRSRHERATWSEPPIAGCSGRCWRSIIFRACLDRRDHRPAVSLKPDATAMIAPGDEQGTLAQIIAVPQTRESICAAHIRLASFMSRLKRVPLAVRSLDDFSRPSMVVVP
jgi:hypothetical protein